MGMSASQVRFLTLQGRKHSIGKQLTMLSNRKMALSRDMDAVALRYNNALNQKVLKWSNNSGEDYNTLSYDLMMRPNELNWERPYIITKASNGAVVLNSDKIMKYSNGKPTGELSNLSYIDIAKMISNCTGVDSSGTPLFDSNNSNLVYAVNSRGEKYVVGGKASDFGWYIPSAHDYSYQNTFRTSIFDSLGLLPADYKEKEKRLLDELYGSKDAQLRGVYSPNCLWGQYYVAVANLYAFEDYFNEPHTYASSDNFAGTQHTEETNPYTNTVYEYNDSLDGTELDNNTRIVQNSGNTNNDGLDPLAHIQFGDVSRLDVQYTDDEQSFTFSTDITNTGLVHHYDYESVWENGLKNYTESDDFVNGTIGYKGARTEDYITINDLIAAVDNNNKMGNSAQLFEILYDPHTEGFDFGGSIWEVDSDENTVFDHSVYNTLGSIIDVFIDVLSSNQILNLSKTDETVAANYREAKEETIKLFILNTTTDPDSGYTTFTKCMKNRDAVIRAASDAALDKNKIGVQRTGSKFLKRTHGYTEAFVDVGSLCNVFLAYFDQLTQGKTINPVTPSPDYEPKIPFGNIDDESNLEGSATSNSEDPYVSNFQEIQKTITVTDGGVSRIVTVADAAEKVTEDGAIAYANGTTTAAMPVLDTVSDTISTINKTYTRREYNYVYDADTQTYQIDTNTTNLYNPYYDENNPSTYNILGNPGTDTVSVNDSDCYPEVDEYGKVKYKKDTVYDTTFMYDYVKKGYDQVKEGNSYKYDDNGRPVLVQQTDENGDPVFEDEENTIPVYLQNPSGNAQLYETNEGELVYTKSKNDGTIEYYLYNDNTKIDNPEDTLKKVEHEKYYIYISGSTAYYYRNNDKDGIIDFSSEVPKYDSEGNLLYKKDEEGNYYVEANDGFGKPILIYDKNGKKVPLKDGNDDRVTIQRDKDGQALFYETSYTRYDTSSDAQYKKDVALYKDASGQPVALFVYEGGKAVFKGNPSLQGDATVIDEQAARNIRVYNPFITTPGTNPPCTEDEDEKRVWNISGQDDTYISTLATIITYNGQKMTLAEYYLSRATTVEEQMKYARCEEVKSYYTDFDSCWAAYTAHDSENNTDRIEYQKLVTYIPMSYSYDAGVDTTTGQQKIKLYDYISYDTAENEFVNHIEKNTFASDNPLSRYYNDNYSIKNIWIMDPENTSELITLKDAYDLRGVKINPDTGLPLDPNLALYIEFDEMEVSTEIYDPKSENEEINRKDKTEMFLTYDYNGVQWDYDNTDDTKTIYGVLEYDLNYFCFTNVDTLKNFIDHPNPDELLENLKGNESKESGVVLFSRYNTDMQTDKYDDFQAQIEAYDAISKYNISILGTPNMSDSIHEQLVKNIEQAKENIKNKENELDDLYAQNGKIVAYYDALFSRIAQAGWTIDENTSSQNGDTANTYLNNKLQNNEFFITECESQNENTGYRYTTRMAQNVRKIFSVYEEDAIDLAIAEFECEKKELQDKEKQIDLVMQKLETEQEAIETTMESVKKVIDDNIKRAFKMFA